MRAQGRGGGRTDGAAVFADLFGLDAVDELVSRRGLRTPFLRVVRDGTDVPARRYTAGGGVGARIGDQVDAERVVGLVASGATLVLQGLHRLWPPLVAFASGLAADLGHPVQVNAYVTPPSAQGFRTHYDTHDVFVLQVHGAKRWVLHPPVLADPLPEQPWTDRKAEVAAAARAEPLLDTVLRPGDSLYLPRGYLHAAATPPGGDVSVHLTVGVHPVTVWTVLDLARRRWRDDPALRRSLPMGLDPGDADAVRAVLDDALAALAGHRAPGLAGPAAEAVAGALARQVGDDTRAEPVAPYAQVRAAGAVDAATAVRVRSGLGRVLDADGLRLVLRTGDEGLAPQELPAARLLLDGAVHAVGDLPLPEPDAAALVRRLLLASVVVPAAARTEGEAPPA